MARYQGLENHYLVYLMCLLLLFQRRGNPVPVTPSFPEAGEIMFELGPSPPQCMLRPHHPSSLRQNRLLLSQQMSVQQISVNVSPPQALPGLLI